MIEFGGANAGWRVLLRRRARARLWAGAVHVAGLLGPGALMLFSERLSVPAGSIPPDLATGARCNVAAVITFAAMQGVTLAAWRRRSQEVRATEEWEPRHRWALRTCVTLLFLMVWMAEIGYFAQAVVSVRPDGWDEPVSWFGIWMIVAAGFTGIVGAAIGALVLLARLVRRLGLAMWRVPGLARAYRAAYAAPAPGPGYPVRPPDLDRKAGAV